MATRKSSSPVRPAPLTLSLQVLDMAAVSGEAENRYIGRLAYRCQMPGATPAKEGYFQGLACASEEEAAQSVFFNNPDIMARRLHALFEQSQTVQLIEVESNQ